MTIQQLCRENQIYKLKVIQLTKERQMLECDYNARLKADMAAILEEIDLQFDEICFSKKGKWKTVPEIKAEYKAIIQQKINELKADQEPTTKNDKVDCEHTDCNNCVNHKYCDYEPTTKNDLGVDCVARQSNTKKWCQRN